MAKKRTKTEQQMTPERERKLAIKAYKERIRYARRKGLTPYVITQFEGIQTEDIKALRKEKLFEPPTWLMGDTEDEYYSDYDLPPKSSNLNLQIIAEITKLIVEFDYAYVAAVYGKSYANHKQQIDDYMSSVWTHNLSDYEDELYTVAYRLENNAEEFKTLTTHLLYDSESIQEESFNIRRWGELLYGGTVDATTAAFLADIAEANHLFVF